MFTIAALYHFTRFPDPATLKGPLQALAEAQGIKGSLLIAAEGINGTIAGSREGIDAVSAFIRSIPGLSELEYKESFANSQPFYRMKVRLKKEIVTIGMADINPNEICGTYLLPEEWNAVAADPDTILIDTRNDYEVKIGTFKNALNPQTVTFRTFPQFVEENLAGQKNKKIAMFCTGGIRCEKASSYMKKMGFDAVYHLKRGILKYLEEIPPEKSLWQGECFVFDQRVSVGHGLTPGSYSLCPSCRHPVSEADKTSDKYEDGVSCPNCHDHLSEERRSASRERQRQIKLAAERGEAHIGAKYDVEGESV